MLLSQANPGAILEKLKSKGAVKTVSGLISSGVDHDIKPKRRSGVKRPKIEYRGSMYSTTALAELLGISVSHLRAGLRKGLDPDTIASKAKTYHEAVIRYEYQGQLYTICELAVLSPVGVSQQTIRHRLEIGWSVENAINEPTWSSEKCSKSKLYEISGKKMTLYQAAKLYQMGRETLVKRVEVMGMSLADAVAMRSPTSRPAEKQEVAKYLYRKRLRTLSQLSRATGVPGYFITREVDDNGLSVEACITLYRESEPPKFTYRGNSYTVKELAKLTGINYQVLRHRLVIRGWSVMKATSTPIKPYKPGVKS